VPLTVPTSPRPTPNALLDALGDVVLDEFGDAQKVRIGGLVQLAVGVKPAKKKRQGRNPATGEEITIAAKPASVDVRARPLARAKEAHPSVHKTRRLTNWGGLQRRPQVRRERDRAARPPRGSSALCYRRAPRSADCHCGYPPA